MGIEIGNGARRWEWGYLEIGNGARHWEWGSLVPRPLPWPGIHRSRMRKKLRKRSVNVSVSELSHMATSSTEDIVSGKNRINHWF